MEYTNQETKNDRWIVEHIFPGEYDKYFIEAGACGGIKDSSCYVLEKYLRWKGICIEPNDDYFQQLVNNRPNSVCENLCLSNQNETVAYVKGDRVLHPMLGGIRANLIEHRQYEPEVIDREPIISKQALTLGKLLKKHHAPRTIHYLSMDIEGSELPVLEVFAFEKYNILAISIEGIQCNDLLFSHGYINVENPFNTDRLYEQYFLHESIASQKSIIITANHYISQARYLSDSKEIVEAIAACQTALSLEPDNSMAHAVLGNCQYQQGNFTEAIDRYRQAIALDRQCPAWIYRSLAGTLQHHGQHEEAIEVYYQAIAIASDTPFWTYDSLGNALSQEQRWSEAIIAYQQAQRLQPDNPLIERRLKRAQSNNIKLMADDTLNS